MDAAVETLITLRAIERRLDLLVELARVATRNPAIRAVPPLPAPPEFFHPQCTVAGTGEVRVAGASLPNAAHTSPHEPDYLPRPRFA